MKKIMPSKASINAGRHPYLRKDFEWPVREELPKSLGPLLNDEEMKALIEKYKEERTFYFSKSIIKIMGVEFDRFTISRNQLKEYVWYLDIPKFLKMKDELVDFVKLDENNWLAETTWIKA